MGGNQDAPTLLTQNAPNTPVAEPLQQQPQQQPIVEMNNSTTLSNLTNGLMALGKILLGSVTTGGVDLSLQNQTKNNATVTTPNPDRGINLFVFYRMYFNG